MFRALLTTTRTAATAARGVRRFAAAAGAQQDIVFVGGGISGYVGAIKAAQLGLNVTCIESRGRLGGTCLNVGCIPSKSLLHSSHMYHEAKHNFASHGVVVGNVSIDLAAMMKNKDTAVEGLTSGIEFLFKKNKVTYEKGFGVITGPNEVTVNGKAIATKNIVIATGSEVAGLPGIEIDEKRVISSTGALALTAVPKRLLLVGGGVIGLEMGSVWSRLGADVTCVEFTNGIAAGADEEVSQNFLRILKKQGFKFMLESKVTSIERPASDSQPLRVTVEPAAGGAKQVLETDVVLMSVGRRAYTKGLGLDKVGVKLDKAGRVIVDEHFRTNVPSIRACGDVIAGPMLAHKAEEETIALVESIVNGGGHVNYGAIPSVVYTSPEVAWVGETEQSLKAKGIDYVKSKFDFKANSRARTSGDTEGFVKMLTDKKTDRLLGVHIINSQAGELIAEATLALEYGASSEDIARVCHSHPTLSEAVKEAACVAAFGKAIHA